MKRLKNHPYKDAEVGLRTDFTDLSSPLHGSLPAGRLAQAGKGQGGGNKQGISTGSELPDACINGLSLTTANRAG